MNGAEKITAVARAVRPPIISHNFLSPADALETERKPLIPSGDGALATADKVLNQLLGNSGFVDVTAPFAQNYVAGIDYRLAPVEVEDTTPGALANLTAEIQKRLAAEADQSEQIQARVPPEAAVRLLM